MTFNIRLFNKMFYVFAFLFLMINAGPSFCSQNKIEPDKEKSEIKRQLVDWMMNYYRHKNPEEVAGYLKMLQQHHKEIWPRQGQSYYVLFGFFTALFADNPGRVGEWWNSQKFSGDLEEALKNALILHNANVNPKSKALLKTKEVHSHILFLAVTEGAILDVFWAAFFASGNVEYIGKIVDVLTPDYRWESRLNEKMIEAIKVAAVWSLLSNMNQHEVVENYMQELAKADTTGKSAVARKMLDLKKDEDEEKSKTKP